MEPARHPQSALIAMNDGGLRQQRFERRLKTGQVFIRSLVDHCEGPRAQRLSVKVLEELGLALVGNELLGVEVEQLSSEAGAVLNRRVDLRGGGRGDLAAGNRAALQLRLMLGHFQRLGRKFKDLALFLSDQWLLA